eukprot:7756768-Pyramimonas_sp.AAC.1
MAGAWLREMYSASSSMRASQMRTYTTFTTNGRLAAAISDGVPQVPPGVAAAIHGRLRGRMKIVPKM